ncbi:MAG: 2-C-methyl-D-erythritol 4-phosphate cytidylyltransferase [Rhodothermales bacterium]
MHSGETTVLIPAAGSGRRMGGERKQFRTLGGAPVLVRTLEVFERHAEVGALVVVGPVGETNALRNELRDYGLTKLHAVVEGGATRQASVGRGLDALPAETEIVLVHDAVRPFLPADALSAVVEAARAHGAAALAIPVADTVRRGDETFGETVPRDGLWRMQTPQAFRLDLLREAHARFAGVPGTDEVELVQRLGRAVRIVEGSALTFKITTPADWTLAEALWPFWEREWARAEDGERRL